MYAQGQPSAALLLQDLPSPEESHPARDHIAYVGVNVTALQQHRQGFSVSRLTARLLCFVASLHAHAIV